MLCTKENSKLGVQDSKGVSLLFVVLIMSVILAVSLGISGILIQQIKMMQDVGYSVVSYYAADSGIEYQLYELYKLEPPHQANFASSLDNASAFSTDIKCGANVAVEDCPAGLDIASSPEECDALNFCLKSIGSYQETKRAIEIKY